MKRALPALLLLAACATSGAGGPDQPIEDGGTPLDGGGVQCSSGACPARPNAIMTCDPNGSCAIGQCLGKFVDCNKKVDDGCEIDTAGDPANCGGCAKACSPVTNGVAKCAAGTCGATCAPGFAQLGAACASYAGAYEENDTGCTACGAVDSFSGSCGCPMGFAAGTVARVLNDCSGTHGGKLTFCQAMGTPNGGEWAGAYQQDDSAGMCPQGCRAKNPYTMACSCPGGALPITLRTLVDTPCMQTIGSNLTLCLYGSAATTTFGGAFEMDDSGGLGCRVPNPKTMMCSCPNGTTKHDYRVVVDIAGGASHGSTISICTP